MTEPLKPCPFCGEANELYPSYAWIPGTDKLEPKPYAIDCLGCGITLEPRKGMDVIAAWNRRASSEGSMITEPSDAPSPTQASDVGRDDVTTPAVVAATNFAGGA